MSVILAFASHLRLFSDTALLVSFDFNCARVRGFLLRKNSSIRANTKSARRLLFTFQHPNGCPRVFQ